jgi:hypothetical protein
MKNRAITFLTTLTLFGLAVTLVIFELNSYSLQQLRHLCERRMADARTVQAALRYLATPEVMPLAPLAREAEIAVTNLPATVRSIATPPPPGCTNLNGLAISNGMAATSTDRMVPI